jgi:5'-3' exonuclease
MTNRLMLLDSASMYYRAFYGVPDRFHGADGTPVNAVRGFIDVIARLVTRFDPDWMVACWDDDWRPQFRVDLVPSYKAHRVGVPVVMVPNPPTDISLIVARLRSRTMNWGHFLRP